MQKEYLTLCLSARNLAFRGSDTTIGSKSNGNFLEVFELLAKYDTVLNELMQRIQNKDTKEHYLSNDTQNELIRLLAKEIESKNLSRNISIILRSVTCNPGVGIDISENFFGYLTVNETTGKGLFDAFLNQAKDWDFNILDCRGQSFDNGANMKGKVKDVQARFLEMNPQALYVPSANHSLNLDIIDGAQSSISAISFFGVLSRLYTLFSLPSPRWEILKSGTAVSVKPQSDTKWESRINCVKPLRYYLKEILEALERLEEHALEKRDGVTATEVRPLTEYIRTWSFLLKIIIWYDVLFQINKSSKLLLSPAISLDILACEIQATNAFLYEYRENGFFDACVKASEIAELFGIERVFPITRSRKKKSIYSYECVDHTRQPEHQYKADFFLPLIDILSLIKACNENSLSVYCKSLQIKLDDIDCEDLEMELKRFVIIIKEEKNAFLKFAQDFLNYIYKEELQETYPNLVIALRIILLYQSLLQVQNVASAS
ncbi:zinc finger MYM-type protein 1-like [Hydra vulgaris]|uniref:zinc finger MYM-type protein 1-like n=1 Tax=Hydra vulgaris TaxID=6087 RepID=UPI0032EA28AD